MTTKQQVGIFGTVTRTNTLLVVYMLGETYPSQISEVLGIALSQVQKAVKSLETAGLVVTSIDGKQRKVMMNPRFTYKNELGALLQKMTVRAVDLQQKMAEYRRRPRKMGKEI